MLIPGSRKAVITKRGEKVQERIAKKVEKTESRTSGDIKSHKSIGKYNT
jgi:hypothetical protein